MGVLNALKFQLMLPTTTHEMVVVAVVVVVVVVVVLVVVNTFNVWPWHTHITQADLKTELSTLADPYITQTDLISYQLVCSKTKDQ